MSWLMQEAFLINLPKKRLKTIKNFFTGHWDDCTTGSYLIIPIQKEILNWLQ